MNQHYGGEHILDLMAECAVNRNKAVTQMIVDALQLSNAPKKILEFGAGKGEFAFRINQLNGIELHAAEADERFRNLLGAKVRTFTTLEESNELYDGIYLIDVLEHLDNDREYLDQMYQRLRPGGRLFIYVPAFQNLYTDFDRSIGHYRRYTKTSLCSVVGSAGFSIDTCFYHDMAGFLLMHLNKVVFGNTTPQRWSAVLYDRFAFPLTGLAERFVRAPFGKSVALIAIKPDN